MGKDYCYNSFFEGKYLYSHLLSGKFYSDGKLRYEGEFLYNKKWNGKEYDEMGNLLFEIKDGKKKKKRIL